MTAPTTLSLDGIAPPTCPTCGDTCLGPDGLDACESCAERAETEYQTWQHIGDVADRVVAKALEARRGRR